MKIFVHTCILFFLAFIKNVQSYTFEQCVFEPFFSDKSDYSQYIQELGEYNKKIYLCYENNAFQVLNKKQQKEYIDLLTAYNQFLIDIKNSNIYLKGSNIGNMQTPAIIQAKTNLQKQIDTLIKKEPINSPKTSICNEKLTIQEKNICYKNNLYNLIDTYIFNGYSPYWHKIINNKPDVLLSFKKLDKQVLSFFKNILHDNNMLQNNMEVFYLELTDAFLQVIDFVK